MDMDDEVVANLRRLGEILSKASPDDLKALLAGKSKIAIVPKSWKPAAPITSSAEARTRLVAADAGDQRRYLADLGLNATNIRKLATELGVKGVSRSTPDEVIEKIVAYFRDASPAVAR